MSNFHCATLWVLFLLFSSNLTAQITLSPEKMLPGEQVSLTYDPQNTDLSEEENIVINVYEFNGNEYEVIELPLELKNNKYVSSFSTNLDTKAMLFEVTNAELSKRDNNGDNGFTFVTFQKDRKTPVVGALASQAYIFAQYVWMAGLDRAPEKALTLLKDEFATNMATLENYDYQILLLSLLSTLKDKEALEVESSKIDQILRNPKASEEDLKFAYYYYLYSKDEEGKEKVKNIGLKAFPNGIFAADEFKSNFKSIKEIEEKESAYTEFLEKYANTASFKNSKEYLIINIVEASLQAEDMDNFRKYFTLLDNRTTKAQILNSFAWEMTGESIEGEAKNSDLAQKLSKESLELLETEMEDMASKPNYYTERRHKDALKNYYAMYADTYALAAYKNGQSDDAFKYQLIACENNDFNDGEMVERYSVYYEDVKSAEETENLLSNFIAKGKATSMMKEQHKRLYVNNNSIESAYSKYLAQLEKSALAEKKEKIKEEMISQEAPNFNLVNLDGESVDLKDLRGKVVVIDFWATWCGPCIKSFPGMQKAVNKYDQSDDVVFLFIDTWESGENIQENVANFIKTNEYSFEVLMDLKGKVVSDFAVKGIPTKFIIDKEGLIRFQSVGFRGNDDALVDEISIMIDLAGGTLPSQKILAP